MKPKTGEEQNTEKAKGKAMAKAKGKAKGKAKAKAKGKAKAKAKGKQATSTGHSYLYGVMWYKKTKCIGIRAKTGQKNQDTSFGGKSVEKSKVQMKRIGYHVCKMLETASSLGEAKKEGERLMHS